MAERGRLVSVDEVGDDDPCPEIQSGTGTGTRMGVEWDGCGDGGGIGRMWDGDGMEGSECRLRIWKLHSNRI